MPVMLMLLLGLGIIIFFISVAVHYIKVEKMSRNTYIKTEMEVKHFLENG